MRASARATRIRCPTIDLKSVNLLTPAPETERETEGEERRQEHRAPLGNRAEEIDGDESSREKNHLRRHRNRLYHGLLLSKSTTMLQSIP